MDYFKIEPQLRNLRAEEWRKRILAYNQANPPTDTDSNTPEAETLWHVVSDPITSDEVGT